MDFDLVAQDLRLDLIYSAATANKGGGAPRMPARSECARQASTITAMPDERLGISV
jgi:hypothetical protein